MNLRLSLSALLYCLLLACSGKERNEGAEVTEVAPKRLGITDAGLVTLYLDTDVNFEYLQKLRGLSFDGKDYVSFYDRQAHSLYVHDMGTGQLFRKIKMEKEGPNGVKTFLQIGYFFHTPDSIFVNGLPNGIYLINGEGEVLSKKNLGLRQEGQYPSFDAPKPPFDEVSSYDNGIIELSTENKYREDKVYERVTYDFLNDELGDEYLKTEMIVHNYDEVKRIKRERTRKGELNFVNPRYFSQNEEYLFVSTAISDTIYAFQESVLKKKIYAGVPEIEIASFASYATLRSIERFEGGMSAVENPRQDAHFKNTLMSPDGKFIYRIYYHGTRPKAFEEGKKPEPYIFGATLIVVDLSTDELMYFDLPVDELDLRVPSNSQVFVTNQGIHIRVKDQESEDQAQYRVYAVKEQ